MDFFPDRTWYALAVACYGLATAHGVLLWRRGMRRGELWNYVTLAVGFCAHTAALMGRGFSLKQCPVTNLFEALMFVTWAICGAYLVTGGIWPKTRSVSVFLAPGLLAAGFFALQPRLDEPGPNFDLEHTAVSLHVSMVLLAYSAFGLASLAGILYLIRERPGASETAMSLSARLPDGARLERVLLRSLGAGLILLTAGLVMSFGLMRERYGVLVRPDPKIAWSILVWVVYLGLMVSRLKFGQAGHRLAWGALGGFLFVVLTFWGTNLLSPIHHP
ncbi:MAG: inner membrane protein YpjD [Limisphaerales bacterium]